jgi:hypothetical protein
MGVSFVGWLLLLPFLAIIFLIAMIKVLWTLVKAYANVVIALIFSPFIILVGAIPGVGSVGSWFKGLISNLAVLPTVLTMVYLAAYLFLVSIGVLLEGLADLWTTLVGIITGGTSLVDFLEAISDHLSASGLTFGGLSGFLILFFLAIGLLLMTPKAADMIKSFLEGKAFSFGSAVGGAIGAATEPGSDIATAQMQRRYTSIEQKAATPGARLTRGERIQRWLYRGRADAGKLKHP